MIFGLVTLLKSTPNKEVLFNKPLSKKLSIASVLAPATTKARYLFIGRQVLYKTTSDNPENKMTAKAVAPYLGKRENSVSNPNE